MRGSFALCTDQLSSSCTSIQAPDYRQANPEATLGAFERLPLAGTLDADQVVAVCRVAAGRGHAAVMSSGSAGVKGPATW